MYRDDLSKMERDKLIDWYIEYKKNRHNFKYSYSFLIHILKKLEDSYKEMMSSDMIYKTLIWIEEIKNIMDSFNELNMIFQKNLHREMNLDNNIDLINIKKDIVTWITQDMCELSNRHHIKMQCDGLTKIKVYDDNGKLFPYIVQGKQRELMEFRLSSNQYYLSKIVEYVTRVKNLISTIKYGQIKSSTSDPYLKIVSESWNP
jgi:hypothetical protein